MQRLPLQVYDAHSTTVPDFRQSAAYLALSPYTAFSLHHPSFGSSVQHAAPTTYSPHPPQTVYSAAAPQAHSIPHVFPTAHPSFTTHTPPPPHLCMAYVPGSFVAGVVFDTLPLDHQNYILKAATHSWKKQYADLQLDNQKLRASLDATRSSMTVWRLVWSIWNSVWACREQTMLQFVQNMTHEAFMCPAGLEARIAMHWTCSVYHPWCAKRILLSLVDNAGLICQVQSLCSL